MFAGFRMGDVVGLTKIAYDGKAIERRTAKSGELVWWPIPEALKPILDEAPKHDAITLLANSPTASRGQQVALAPRFVSSFSSLSATAKSAPG